jgi:hypothetical protein
MQVDARDAVGSADAPAAELESIRRAFPRYKIDKYPHPGGSECYSATRRPGEQAHPYHVSTSDLAELCRELAAGEGPVRM